MPNIYQLDNYHNEKTPAPAFFYTLDNCMISNVIRQNQIWEPYLHAVFDAYVKPDSVVIECGCHIGTHTIKLARLCKTLYGFEPFPKTNQVLHMNIGLNRIENAIISNHGVSSEPGSTTFSFMMDGNPGSSALNDNPMGNPPIWGKTFDERIDVTLTTIDALGLDKVDFMKIDVEGYETRVIQGAMETIQRCKPVIVMEVWANQYGGVDMNYTRQTFRPLLDMGYDVTHIGGPDFLFIHSHF